MMIEQQADPALEKREDIPGQTDDNEPAPAGKPAKMPPAGPHATPENTNDEATPGAGAFPADETGDEVDPGTG